MLIIQGICDSSARQKIRGSLKPSCSPNFLSFIHSPEMPMFYLIVYRMGGLCRGAHEITGIHTPLFLYGWVIGGFIGWPGGWWCGGWVGGGMLVGGGVGGVLVRGGVVGLLHIDFC